MRFPISYNAISRVLLTILGMPQSQAYVDVTPETVKAKMSWAGSVAMRRSDIASVERLDRVPLTMGLGVHGNFRGAWAFNGASAGAVKISLSRSGNGRVLFFPIHPTDVYLSLEEPDEFVNAVRA